MNLSLRNRVAASFIIATVAVLMISFLVFHHLNSLNRDIELLMEESNKLTLLTDEVRVSAVKILKYQRELIANQRNQSYVDNLIQQCDGFLSQLQQLDNIYEDKKMEKVIGEMKGYVNSLLIVLGKGTFIRNSGGQSPLSQLADKILESFTEFQVIQLDLSEQRDQQINRIINDTKRNMMYTLIIGFLVCIILFLILPGKIALPFKKIKDAIRELQDCNFDVNIYYNQDDEIGEISTEMNKMITSMKRFEELRSDRINVEKRKFDALANLVKKPVLICNADGRLIYMNNKLYELLEVQSDDVISKDMKETLMPTSIIETFNLAIKRRSKIDNAEITIMNRDVETEETDEEGENSDNILYKGFANVIPVRGRESSLDYYLMVLSREVFQ